MPILGSASNGDSLLIQYARASGWYGVQHSVPWNELAVNANHPDLAGMTVLLIDDDPDGRDAVQRILEARGAVVVACASAREAFEACETCIPSIVVCDLSMPDIDGLAFLTEFRLREQQLGIRSVPAVALTGLDLSANIKDAARAGFQVYLEKPIEPAVFLEAVAKLAREEAR